MRNYVTILSDAFNDNISFELYGINILALDSTRVMNSEELISMDVGETSGLSNAVMPSDNTEELTVVEHSPIDQQTEVNYRIWKKNAPFLYDYITTHSLLWPSLTVQFFPDLEKPLSKEARLDPFQDFKKADANESKSENEISIQRILLGTFTLGQSTDSISILQLPYYTNLNKNLTIDKLDYNHEKEEFELTKVAKKKINVLQKINHWGDVNKLRYMPQNPDVIASSNNLGNLVIYDRTKHASFKNSLIGEDTEINKPQLHLINEWNLSDSDIFAIDWNKQKEGVIISANMEGNINLYDIKSKFTSKDVQTINESQHFSNSSIAINDIEWIPNHDSIFTFVDDQGSIKLLDIRLPEHQLLILQNQKSDKGINSVSVNPSNSTCLATGDIDGIIDVWDIRMFGSGNANSVYSIKNHHQGSITQVKWHPKYHNILASSSSDKLVKIFDLSTIEEEEKGLMFTHAGHMLGVNDLDWSLHDDWLVASIADDNSLHVWKPSNQLVKHYKTI